MPEPGLETKLSANTPRSRKKRAVFVGVGVVFRQNVALDADDPLLAQPGNMHAGDSPAIIDRAVVAMMMIVSAVVVVVVIMIVIVMMVMVVMMIVRAVDMFVRAVGMLVRVGLVLLEGDSRFAASAYAAHQSISISRIFNSSPAVICTR